MMVCKKPEGRLISYSIKSAGGMLGSVIKTNVRLSKDGTCALIFNGRQNSWQHNMAGELYEVDSKIMDELAEVISRRELYKAQEAKISPYIVYDAPTIYYGAEYDGGDEFIAGDGYRYTSAQLLDMNICDGHKEIDNIIKTYKQKGTKLPTIKVSGEPFEKDETEKISLVVENYDVFTIMLKIYNNASEMITVSGDILLSKLDGDEKVYTKVIEQVSNLMIWNNPPYEAIISLPKDEYFDEGTYQIEFLEYTIKFEVAIQ